MGRMSLLIDLIAQYGVWFVFLCVLIEQAGAPIPAYPVLLVAGSLAASGQQSAALLLAVAVLACLVSDSLWYAAGQRYGRRVLGTLCRLSLTPDGCVRQTETIFERFGPRSLIVAKFVPGFASVATAMAGSTGVGRLAFLVYDGLGAALWAGTGLLLGGVFAAAVEDILLVLEQMGRWGLLFLGVLLAGFIATKLWRRRLFQRQLRMERISVQALSSLREQDEPHVLVDVRAALGDGDERIPGAVVMVDGDWPAQVDVPAKDALVVVYCNCPNEASAALLARRLQQRGYRRALPLAGGIEAWRAAGFALEAGRPAATPTAGYPPARAPGAAPAVDGLPR